MDARVGDGFRTPIVDRKTLNFGIQTNTVIEGDGEWKKKLVYKVEKALNKFCRTYKSVTMNCIRLFGLYFYFFVLFSFFNDA